MANKLKRREAFTAIDLPDGAKASATALTFAKDTPFEAWEKLGLSVQRVGGAVMWWIGDWWNFGEHKYGERAAAVLDADTLDYDTFRAAGWVAAKIETVRRRTDLSFSHHREVAALPPVEQDAMLTKAAGEGWTREQLRSGVRAVRLATARDAKMVGAAALSAEAGRFPVLYADPPWRYDFAETKNREIENQYPTMDLASICTLPVADVTLEDCVLFLWTTSPKLEESFAVLSAWGFTYKTSMVWAKDKIGMGYYARQQHEILLIATKGEPPTPAPENRPPSVITADRGEHSAKPIAFYEVIERMYPGLPKLELFSRAPREGWSAWGNEAAA